MGGKNLRVPWAQLGQHPSLEEEVTARLQTERPSGLLQEPLLGQQRRPSESQPTMGSPVIRSPRDSSEPLPGFLPARGRSQGHGINQTRAFHLGAYEQQASKQGEAL